MHRILVIRLYFLLDALEEKKEMGWACGTYGGWERCTTRCWWGKPEEKRSMGRPRCRWEENIKMDLQEVGCGGMD
jgi:hypothetical protein